jgi:hypothetical protein
MADFGREKLSYHLYTDKYANSFRKCLLIPSFNGHFFLNLCYFQFVSFHMRLIKLIISFSLLVTFVSSCFRDELTQDILVYSNDFESNDLTDIIGGKIMTFDNNEVIGNFNNDGFRLSLNGLPDHEYLFVSFDLLIHDTWDGNFNGFENDFPDSWVMELNSEINLIRGSNIIFETTFSNTPCDSNLCLWQSYPNSYPFLFAPQTGRSSTAPGLCAFADRSNGTSIYRIQKTLQHKDKAVVFDFYDKLYQPNAPSQMCDESWSMDNLQIRVLTIN